MKKTFIQCYRF